MEDGDVEKRFHSSDVTMDALRPCRFSVMCDVVPSSQVSRGCGVKPARKKNTKYQVLHCVPVSTAKY
jgi:hypothetical protein